METNIKVHPSMESALFKPDKSNVSVGRYTYGTPKCLTWSGEERIRIGSFCSIADEVSIFGGGEHRTDWITTFPLRIMFGLPGAWNDGIPCAKGETIVGNDVWIGYGAMILSGVTVGDGAVIGAGSVVTKNVPPYSIVAGNPARIVGERFETDIVNGLLEIQWWRWPIERIIDNVDLLCSNNPEALNEFNALHRGKNYDMRTERNSVVTDKTVDEQEKCEEMLFTGERFVPDLDGQIAYEHLHRYSVACEYVSGKSVLDIASGEGYGSNLLAKTAKSVIGVDISVEAVNHANAKYKEQKNLEYRAGSCTGIPCEDNLFDVVVSFETIEHITEHELMLKEVKRVLKPDGVLIISSPNKEIYLDDNEFHLKELDYDEFDTLLKSYFKNIEMIGQIVVSASHMWFMDGESTSFRNYSGNNNGLVSKDTPPYEPMYFIALCSDLDGAMLGAGEQSLFTDGSGTLMKQVQQLQAHVADKERQIEELRVEKQSIIDSIHSSLSWRITSPLRKVAGLLHSDKNEEDNETAPAVVSSGIKAQETVDLIELRSIDEFQAFLATGVVEKRFNDEKQQAEQKKNKKSWRISGYCEACAEETSFLVDWSFSDGVLPNYRERVICKGCGLNNRQRFVLSLMKKFISEVEVTRLADVYLYEMVTPIYRYASENFKDINLTGSEYLGFEKKPGEVIDGIRHEDAMKMSFKDGSFDILVSNDVYEHVPDIEKSISEAFRVLKKGGKLLFSIPFLKDEYKTEQRSVLQDDGSVEKVLPEIYHGNPLDKRGSLVFYHFGWDILELCKKVGFRDAYSVGYYSLFYGYLGDGLQLVFVAEK